MVNPAQQDLINELRRRLNARAWLADDRVAYRDGVEDALEEVTLILLDDDEHAIAR